MQSWLVTIRVTDDGIEDDNVKNYMNEQDIKDEIFKINDLPAGLEITDITDIVKEK